MDMCKIEVFHFKSVERGFLLFFLNKDITHFAYYANFNHYHFFQVLAK